MRRVSRLFPALFSTAVVLLCAGLAQAGPPAALKPADPAQVRKSFDQFAQQWLDKVKRNAVPTPGGGRREYADYTIELRATGQSSAPWVGLLRYTENLIECSAPGQCATTAAVPVTEIFRFEGGRWIY